MQLGPEVPVASACLPAGVVGIRLAVEARVARFRSRGTTLCAIVAIAFVGVFSVPPMHIETTRVTGRLSDALGFPLDVREARWQSLLWPEIRLADIHGVSHALPWLPLRVRADRAVLTGYELLEPPRRGAAGAETALVEGFSIHSDFLSLCRGTLRLDALEGEGMRVRGRADGTQGGWVEVIGALGGEPTGDPLRIYLADLVVPLVPPALGPGGGDEPALRLEGSIETRPHGSEGELAELDLRVVGVRAERAGHWLEGRVQGRWSRQAGLTEPGTELRGRFELREMGGARDMHALHGPVDAQVSVTGERVSAEVDLDRVRVVLRDWFAKQPGERARISLRARLADGGLSRARAELRTEWGTLHAVREADARGEWRLETSWVALDSVRHALPALASLALAGSSTGSARLRGHWSPEGGLRARAELRDVRVPGLRTGVPEARIDLAPDRTVFRIPGLLIDGQKVEVHGSVRWEQQGPTAPLTVLLEARAPRIDLERLSDSLSPLWGGPGKSSPATEASWQEAAVRLLGALRARPKLLERLDVQRAWVDVGHVTGLGLDQRAVALRLSLAERVMRVEQLDPAESQPVRSFDIDLDGWMPRFLNSAS